jgi:hypothetical protein
VLSKPGGLAKENTDNMVTEELQHILLIIEGHDVEERVQKCRLFT